MTKHVFEVIGQPHADRAARVAQLRELGFGWADIEDEPYWIDQLVLMPRALYGELEAASAKLWHILDKTARHVMGKPEFYELLGIPDVLWDALDLLPVPPKGLISKYARFDFAISNEGAIKLLELNADTPTGYVEAAIATPWLCSEAGVASPNEGMAGYVAAAWGEERLEAAACVDYGTHIEDSGTIEALAKHSGLPMRCLDCLDLWVDEGIMKDGEGNTIRSLFALYPKEWMAVDEGGEAFAYAVENGELKLHNPIHSIVLQSKGLLAAVWGLYELGMLFDPEEREAIGQYMLPAYNNPVFEGSFVSKSMFGREGGSVRLFDGEGELELADEDGFDTSELFPLVFQKRAELARIHTAEGELHLLTGMFVINGTPCGMLGRAGGPITGNTSHFVALGVRD
ncbi:glutathionylspermidine synthase family protein [Paenibacillus rhizovicinus]|uniref:Glutathionylspermidine synthase family protein n=1 Tax=Paenibacillus rhizovicinus TaxID=2704463 RepID=A0A6C0NY40_9BACL|nr:glutathionylspermidine synthase family protein [Paenibacillus rhizovicinus]QHW31061.1 glutathionylspermidine synthase family protein [Paenibacillus rhizovicinus]